METLLKIYNVLIKIKLKAILYTTGLLFFIGFTNIVYHQNSTFSIWVVLEIFFVSFIACALEPLCFKYLKNKKQAIITWLVLANIIFISMASIGTWFLPLPLYAYIVLIIFFQLGSLLVYASIDMLQTIDSHQLNRSLQSFQQKYKQN